MRKYLVVYSSKTGNTKKLAESARVVLGNNVDIIPIEQNPLPIKYHWTAVGFWIDKDDADDLTQAYLAKIQNQPVALFCTLGTPPTMPQAKKCMDNAISHLGANCKILGTFISQGKVDIPVATQVEKIAKQKGDHKMLQLFRDVIKSAETHPDAEDIKLAQSFFISLAKQSTTDK